MRNKMKLTALAALAMVTLGLGACSEVAEKPADAPVAVTIGGPPNISFLADIAAKKGYFTEEGISVTIQPIQTGKMAQDAVVGGKLDYGVVLDVNLAALSFQRGDVRALGVIMTKSDDGLVARRDRGIKAASDLAGKKVARLTATTSHVYIDRLIESAGVNPDSVTFVTMPPPAMQAALVRGDIDAASLWQPFRQNTIAQLGANAFSLDGGALYGAKVVVIRRAPSPAAADGQEVRVLRALRRAGDFARQDPAAAQAIVAPSLGLPPATVAALWPFYQFSFGAPETAQAEIERLSAWTASAQPDLSGKTSDYATIMGDGSYARLAAN